MPGGYSSIFNLALMINRLQCFFGDTAIIGNVELFIAKHGTAKHGTNFLIMDKVLSCINPALPLL